MTTSITRQATIQRLRVQNYRVLRDVQFSDLTPLTVLLGPNGSGKSTVFDVFAFLHEAFTTNLRAAWDRRNRIHELRSRGASGPITIEIAYRQAPGERFMNVDANRSRSFQVFRDGVRRLVAGGTSATES
ncbi:MAG: AAA family ATPase [Pseudonocardiaceae bacterium]